MGEIGVCKKNGKGGRVRLFSVMRNEEIRLSYFFEYYRDRGVHDFFIIDNGSTDGTMEFLIAQPDVTLFRTEESYKNHWGWVEQLVNRYGMKRWCLVVDADELLVYPHCDQINILTLLDFFEQEGSKALHCVLLEMYSKGPIQEAVYERGDNPLRVTSFFDGSSHHKMRSRYYGGVRERAFGITPCISKYPLVYIEKGVNINQGMHDVGTLPKSGVRGALLHFKFLNNFYERATDGEKRGVYWNDSLEYKAYSKILEIVPNLSLWNESSVKLNHVKQLEQLGIMATSESFEKFLE